VEEPRSWIVSGETNRDIVFGRPDVYNIPLDRVLIVVGFAPSAPHNMESMSMQMEWVLLEQPGWGAVSRKPGEQLTNPPISIPGIETSTIAFLGNVRKAPSGTTSAAGTPFMSWTMTGLSGCAQPTSFITNPVPAAFKLMLKRTFSWAGPLSPGGAGRRDRRLNSSRTMGVAGALVVGSTKGAPAYLRIAELMPPPEMLGRPFLPKLGMARIQ
jgi:hypothetical protein